MILGRIITKSPVEELYPQGLFPIMGHIQVLSEPVEDNAGLPSIHFGRLCPLEGTFIPEWGQNQRLFKQRLEDFLYNLPQQVLKGYKFRVLNNFFQGPENTHDLLRFLSDLPNLRGFHAGKKKTFYLESEGTLYALFYPVYQYMGEDTTTLADKVGSLCQVWVDDRDGSRSQVYEQMFFGSDFLYRILPLLV